MVRSRRIAGRSLTATIESAVEPLADPTSRWSAADVLIAATLVVAAFVKRLPLLPYGGMFHDDAWQAASITLTTPGQWLRTSIDHPLFVALLSPLRYLGQANPVVLVVPVLVAGALAPAVVFAMLRSLRYTRSIATSLAAVLVVAPGPVVLSAHLKTYVVDLVIVAVAAMVLPKLASMGWTARGGVLWFCGAVLVGTFSVFALVATALAGVMLVFAAGPDRRTRAIAVGSQLVVQLLYSRHVRTTYSVDRLQHFWSSHDAFVRFDWNPVVFVGRLFEHVRRVVGIVPGPGRGWVTALVAIVALVGLLLAARRRQSIAARFLLLLLVAAAVAGTMKLLPFGPNPGTYLGRVSLWLAPVVAVGLAEMLRRVRARVPANLRRAFDGAAYGFAIVLIALSMGQMRSYAPSGMHSAVAYVERDRHPSDLVVVLYHSQYGYALETRFPVELRADPSTSTGTTLRFGRGVLFDEAPRLQERLRDLLPHVRTVFTIDGIPLLDDMPQDAIVHRELAAAGFVPAAAPKFDNTQVVVWGRAPD